LAVFPNSKEYDFIIDELAEDIQTSRKIEANSAKIIAEYLFNELKDNDTFTVSNEAIKLKEAFEKELKTQKATEKFKQRLNGSATQKDRIELVKHWVSAFAKANENTLVQYVNECVACILYKNDSASNTAVAETEITDLKGVHPSIIDSTFQFSYHRFSDELEHFNSIKVPAFAAFKSAKHEVIEQLKEQLRLDEFKPRVLSSFVRNKLINQVYFPLIGDNLAKQLGTVGDTKRVDRMGLLLLISPPGYGKTTLMEYVANRLGLIFMKINGPAIGHEVTSVDPEAANNSAAREELKKLNLAFEMGDNVMLYLDDIQHCNPEFLQKFISLSDGTRKIEGVYQGKPKTYDLRSKKFCVIMAGNPYTESGEKFQIPDMLANRADIYNLGDIIGDTAHLFELSLIENALTSNPVLQQLSTKYFDDVYTLIDRVQHNTADTELKGNHSNQEVADYVSVIEKVIKIRNTVLKVNETYIASAGMEDSYRTEPSFKLQGSYRDMNKLVAKVVPIMDDKELQTLVLSHYENESQTLTSAAEANLLKYKELSNSLTEEELQRWEDIKVIFAKNNKLNSLGGQNQMSQIIAQMVDFTDNIEGIKEILRQGFLDKR
jgi:MoxR-like ATPase